MGIEASSSIHYCETSHSPRPRRSLAAYPFQRSKIRLSDFGHQFEIATLAHRYFLCQTSYGREKHPRACLRLSVSQDPNSGLAVQCRFLSDNASRIQSSSLVQALVLTTGISVCNARYRSHRFPRPACEIDKTRQSESAHLASRLSLPKAVRNGAKQDRETQSPMNCKKCSQISGKQPVFMRSQTAWKTVFTHF